MAVRIDRLRQPLAIRRSSRESGGPRWVCLLAICVAVLFAPRPVTASPSARLVYLREAGAESCPDEASIRSAVAARLGYDPFFLNAPETMFIEIAREKGGYRARIKLVDANTVVGTREIAQAGSSCNGMIDTLALSMSIAIDPDSLARAAPTTIEAAPVAIAPREPSPPPEPSVTPAPPSLATPRENAIPNLRSRPVHFELWLAPALWFASGPDAALGGEIGARLRWTHASVGLSMRGDLPASRTIDGVDVVFGFLGASASACGHLSLASACALGTFGRLTASSNAEVARTDSAPRALLGASIGAELPANDSVGVFARAIGNTGIGDKTVVLNGAKVLNLPQLSLGFELGAAIRF